MHIPLEQRTAHSPLEWTVAIAGSILTPSFCLLLGFGVLLVRPRDPLAWLLLALMLSFAVTSSSAYGSQAPGSCPRAGENLALACLGFFQISWAAWILLFGIYFPERLELDRRFPWAKWLLILPVAASGVAHMVVDVAEADNVASVAAAVSAATPRDEPWNICGHAVGLRLLLRPGHQERNSPVPPTRAAGYILLQWGASAALTPLFFVAIWGILRGWDNVPAYLDIPGFLMLAVFPLTLAYVSWCSARWMCAWPCGKVCNTRWPAAEPGLSKSA